MAWLFTGLIIGFIFGILAAVWIYRPDMEAYKEIEEKYNELMEERYEDG